MQRLPSPPPEDGPLPKLPPAKHRRELRVRMGILAKTAAEEIGVSANSFGYWERGERVPRPEHLRVYYSQLYRWQEAIEQVT